MEKNKIFVYFFLFLLTLIFICLTQFSPNGFEGDYVCKANKYEVKSYIENETQQNQVVYSKYELSIFPEIENLECISKVMDINYSELEKDPYTDKSLVYLQIGTSSNLKYLITLFSSLILVICSQMFTKFTVFQYNMFTIFVNFLIVNFFSPEALIYEILLISFPTIVSITALNIISFKKLYTYISLKITKRNLYLIFLLFNIPLIINLISLRFSIDYYLISYNHGFVKRGFLGTFFYNLPFSTPIITSLIVIFILFIYLFISYVVINLVDSDPNLGKKVLLFSPTFLLFPVYQVVNNKDGGLATPEIFGLAAYLFVIFYYDKLSKFAYLFITFCVIISSIYIHEVNFFVIPFVIYHLCKQYTFRKLYLFFFILLIAISIFLFLYFINNESYGEKSNLICNDILEMQIRETICENAINNLALDHLVSVDYKYKSNIHWNWINSQNGSYTSYLIIFFLAILPLNFFKFTKLEILMIIFVSLFYLPLFLNAWDWGRWLYLLFSCLYITVIKYGKNKNITYSFTSLYLVLIYSFTWFNSYCCSIEAVNVQSILKNNLLIYALTFPFIYYKLKKIN